MFAVRFMVNLGALFYLWAFITSLLSYLARNKVLLPARRETEPESLDPQREEPSF